MNTAVQDTTIYYLVCRKVRMWNCNKCSRQSV